MATWKSTVDGSWNDASQWDTGVVPGRKDAAEFSATGHAYTVSAGAPIAVGAIDATGPVTLLFTGGTSKMRGNLSSDAKLGLDSGDLQGGSRLIVRGEFNNQGTLLVGNHDLSDNTTLRIAQLDSLGTAVLTGSAQFRASIIIDSAAPATLDGSTYLTLTGRSLLQFASGQITAIGPFADLTLDGSEARVTDKGGNASNSALAHLAANSGFLELEHGASIVTGNDFNNALQITIVGGSLSLGGVLTNTGFGNIVLDGSAAQQGLIDATALVNSYGVDVGGDSLFHSHDGTQNTGRKAQMLITHGGEFRDDFSYTQDRGALTAVDGTLSAPTIAISAGLLGGTGTLAGAVSITGGDVWPGYINTIGTLSIDGNLALGSKATVNEVFDLANRTASEMTVTGSVTLSNTALKLDILNSAFLGVPGDVYTLMTFAPSSLHGHFSGSPDLDIGHGQSLELAYDNAGGRITMTVVSTPAHAELPDAFEAQPMAHGAFGTGDWV